MAAGAEIVFLKAYCDVAAEEVGHDEGGGD